MTRGRITLALVAPIVFVLDAAQLFGALWQWLRSGDLSAALPEGARLLFAIEAGIAFRRAVLLVTPLVRRNVVRSAA